MGNIKGTGLVDAVEYFEKVGGPGGLEKVKTALNPQVRAKLFAQSLLPVSWYDYAAYMEFILTASKLLGKEKSEEVLYNMSVYQAQKVLNGVYRAFFRILTTEFVLKRFAHLWRLSYDAGDITILEDKKGHIEVKLANFPDIPPRHEVENLPYFEEIMRLCHCREPKATHPRCIARGDDYCLFVFDWKTS
jgi:hypothetical protein